MRIFKYFCVFFDIFQNFWHRFYDSTGDLVEVTLEFIRRGGLFFSSWIHWYIFISRYGISWIDRKINSPAKAHPWHLRQSSQRTLSFWDKSKNLSRNKTPKIFWLLTTEFCILFYKIYLRLFCDRHYIQYRKLKVEAVEVWENRKLNIFAISAAGG